MADFQIRKDIQEKYDAIIEYLKKNNLVEKNNYGLAIYNAHYKLFDAQTDFFNVIKEIVKTEKEESEKEKEDKEREQKEKSMESQVKEFDQIQE